MLKFPVLAYRNREPDKSADRETWNRLRLSAKDDFYLRTTKTGYDWRDPDPDKLMPASHPKPEKPRV